MAGMRAEADVEASAESSPAVSFLRLPSSWFETWCTLASDRERFSQDELADVLAHYDLGAVSSAREFPRGSRRAPKLVVDTDRGRFLVKRRAAGRDDPGRVAFAHALVRHLRDRRFPVPALIEPTSGPASPVSLRGRVYEVFEFVEGERYDDSLEQTLHAGYTLARYQLAVADFLTAWGPPVGSYHNAASVCNALNAIPTTTASHDSVVGHEAELLHMTQELHEIYDAASERVEALGIGSWRCTIIHGDWHPGNLLFKGERVCALLDFDAARSQPAVIDVAYGLLQFSILRGPDDPEHWPDYGDESRSRRFWAGYVARIPLSADQRRAIPDLMIEALVGEAVLPIAVTGSFGRLPGFGVLKMVRRKSHWLLRNKARFQTWLLE